MKLNLNENVLHSHIQKYPKSCVPMGIEFILKLMGTVDINYYELQDEKCDECRSGMDFNGRIISNILISVDFNFQRGSDFPLENLIQKIKAELDAGRFVNCAVKIDNNIIFHEYVIYGYDENELFAITKHYNIKEVIFVNNMTTALINNMGSDIITYTIK